MGVWIETPIGNGSSKIKLSHPVWVCGLKQHPLAYNFSTDTVTPCMGVWIETN